MELGLDVAQHQLDWDELLRRARLAEDAGFDGVWVFDHFKALYGDPAGPCLEGWTLLAALAAATTRVRLGTLVTGVTYRHPSVLAAEVVTVDHVSAGRVELGIGAAWFETEHRELGITFPPTGERIERLEEAVQVLRLLMTTDAASFDGRHYRLDGATLRPRPVQDPHPPVWIGASGERRMLPLVGRHADVWHTSAPVEVLHRKARIVDEHAERAGRDPAAIRRAANLSLSQPLDDVRRDIEALAAAGISYLVVGWPSEGQEPLERFAADVLPELSA
jgi:F420-dependent oxidoreductase-like protein